MADDMAISANHHLTRAPIRPVVRARETAASNPILVGTEKAIAHSKEATLISRIEAILRSVVAAAAATSASKEQAAGVLSRTF